jgi:hypothetical protein
MEGTKYAIRAKSMIAMVKKLKDLTRPIESEI